MTPVVGVDVELTVPQGERSVDESLSLGVSGALPILDRLYAELGVAGGTSFAGNPTGTAAAGARMYLTPRAEDQGALSLFVGGGVAGRQGWMGVVQAGVAADLPVLPGWSGRIALLGELAPGSGDAFVGVRVGALLPGRPAPEPAVVVSPPLPPPVPAPPPIALTVVNPPAGTMVWLPHPVCDWVPLESASALLATLPAPVSLRVTAPGYLPVAATLDGPLSVELRRAPAQGHLVVAAFQGDQVEIDGAHVWLGADGAAVVAHAVGPATVRVTGGGRTLSMRVEVESIHATWLRVPDPRPWEVTFAQGSAVIRPAAEADLRDLVGRLGDERVRVVGGYSVEGARDANIALARARAVAVRDKLLALGVPAERVEVGEPVLPAPDRPAELQRLALVIPVSP